MRRRPALVLACAGAALAAAAPAPRELELESFNHAYQDLVGELAPYQAGPLTVRLSSPRQTVVVRDHVARLTPLGGGRAEGTLEIDLLGKGELVADVDLAGQVSRLADELILPPQRVRLDGAVRVARAEAGYRIVPERLPTAVTVEIRSRLIDQVVNACEGAALLAFGALDCAPVAAALERPSVPLPGAGGEYLLPDAELDAADRAELDALIAAPAP